MVGGGLAELWWSCTERHVQGALQEMRILLVHSYEHSSSFVIAKSQQEVIVSGG